MLMAYHDACVEFWLGNAKEDNREGPVLRDLQALRHDFGVERGDGG